MGAPWPALIAVAVLAALHLSAGSVNPVGGKRDHRWLSFAGGITVAYVFIHILPDLAEYQEAWLERRPDRAMSWFHHQVYVGALAGLVLAYAMDHVSAGSETTRFRLRLASFTLYNLIIGYYIARIERPAALVLATVALGAHFIVNDRAFRRENEARYLAGGRFVLAGAVLAGGVLGRVLDLSELLVAPLYALLAGGIILHALDEEVPPEHEGRVGWFTAGAITYGAVILAAVSLT
jgi:hypothetical protein